MKNKLKEIKIVKPSKKINLSQLNKEIQIHFNLSQMIDDNSKEDYAGLSSDDKYITLHVREGIELDKTEISAIIDKHIPGLSEMEKIKQQFDSPKLIDKINAIAKYIGLKEK